MSWHGPSIAASEKPFPRALATPSVTRRYVPWTISSTSSWMAFSWRQSERPMLKPRRKRNCVAIRWRSEIHLAARQFPCALQTAWMQPRLTPPMVPLHSFPQTSSPSSNLTSRSSKSKQSSMPAASRSRTRLCSRIFGGV